MSGQFRKFFKNGITRIPKEIERTFFFYATLVFLGFYIFQSFFSPS